MGETLQNSLLKKVKLLLVIPLVIVFYYGTLWAIPFLIQKKVLASTGIRINSIKYSDKPTPENNRVVPLPNPDFLYSLIGYDVTDSILKITGPIPDSTYWSISTYQGNTTNYFVLNNRQIKNHFEFYLVKEGYTSHLIDTIPKSRIIYSPTNKGVVLFRNLLSKAYSDSRLAELQHQVKVETIIR